MGEVDQLEEWNAAVLRLGDYLRAHRVHDRAHLLRLSLELLEAARAEHARQPERSPLEVTMALATDRTEAWFSQLADDSGPPNTQLAARGRAAWFASGLYRNWPSSFLDPSPPPELLEAARSASLEAGPALEYSSLLRKEVDYGPMEDIAHETWEQFSWGHVTRAFVIWVFIFFALYGSYLYFVRP